MSTVQIVRQEHVVTIERPQHIITLVRSARTITLEHAGGTILGSAILAALQAAAAPTALNPFLTRSWSTAGLLTDRPAADPAAIGRFYLATDEGVLYRDNGTTWDVAGRA
jgi:hypothetical protein